MALPSQAQVFLERFKTKSSSERVTELKSYIGSNPPTFETHWREFKGATERGNPLDDETVKKHWGKALSAFSNTEGGILIWGIDAREDRATKIDAAHGFALTPNAAALTSRLQELQGTLTDPPVLGCEIICVPDGEGPQGFVVCYVPNSPHRPHRAEPQKNYYIRTEGSSIIPVPSLLRSLFYPRSQPRIHIFARGSFEQAPQPGGTVKIQAWLHNNGPATADDVCVLVTSPETCGFDGESWISIRSGWTGKIYAARRPIHPGEMYDLFKFSGPQSMRSGQGGEPEWFLSEVFSIRIFARNLQPVESIFQFENQPFGRNFEPPMTEAQV